MNIDPKKEEDKKLIIGILFGVMLGVVGNILIESFFRFVEKYLPPDFMLDLVIMVASGAFFFVIIYILFDSLRNNKPI